MKTLNTYLEANNNSGGEGDPQRRLDLLTPAYNVAANTYENVPTYGGSGTGMRLTFAIEPILRQGFTGNGAYASDYGGQISSFYFIQANDTSWVNLIPGSLVMRFGDAPGGGGNNPIRVEGVDFTFGPGQGVNEGYVMLNLVEPYAGPNHWVFYAEWQYPGGEGPQNFVDGYTVEDQGVGYRYGEIITVALPKGPDTSPARMPLWVVMYDPS
jgi:hypothetical protein